MRVYWRPRRGPFAYSMPFWLVLPFALVWLVVVLGVYLVIAPLWLVYALYAVVAALVRATATAVRSRAAS
jgi:hypothetical protein